MRVQYSRVFNFFYNCNKRFITIIEEDVDGFKAMDQEDLQSVVSIYF